MSPSGPAHLADGREIEAIEAVGQTAWEAMEKVVDTNPTYQGVEGPERLACIFRLVCQAVMGHAIDLTQGDGRVQAYVVISGMGRALGQMVYAGAPAFHPARIELLNQQMVIGKRDADYVLEPKGRA